MDTKEVLLTTSRTAQHNSACLWDPTSGNVLHLYKNGGPVAPASLNIVSDNYLMTVAEDKPVVQVWPLNSQEPIKQKTTILPARAAVFTTCPRGAYGAAAIGTKLYLWHLGSGKLFSVQQRHFQPISCVKFSPCGAYVATGGQDGIIVVYSLLGLVGEGAEPLYSRHDHTMPITGLAIGDFGHKSRLVSVSRDHTCRLYTLVRGDLLLNLVADEPITSVTIDGPWWNLYLGLHSGNLQHFDLKSPPRGLERHLDHTSHTFKGHKKAVTCLDLNPSGTLLVSGSDDHFVFVWEVKSRSVLRQLEHKAEVTNVRFVLNHDNFFAQNMTVVVGLGTLERDLFDRSSQVFESSRLQDWDIELGDGGEGPCDDRLSALESENAKLRAINRQLYETAVQISTKYNNL